MLDCLCDYLIAFKEVVDSRGVIYPTGPTSSSAMTMTNDNDSVAN